MFEWRKNLTNDMWGGLAGMLVALPSSVAFGIMVYSNLGAEYSGTGALAGLLGAAALGLVTPFIGRTGGLIAAPCAPSAAVLSALISGLMAGRLGQGLGASEVLPLVALTCLLSAVLQIFYGLLGGGKLIKFIPYQVVTGYLSGVGVLIALGQAPKFFGFSKGIQLGTGLLNPELWQWKGVVVGLLTILAMTLAPRLTSRIPAAIFGLVSGVFSYFILSIFFPELREMNSNPLIIGPISATGDILTAAKNQIASIFQIRPELIKQILVPAGTLSVLLSIDTLKTCVGLDALTRGRHHSDRELIGQGCGNLASFFIGGMPGAGTMGPTLVNLTSGGRTPRSGMFEGVFVLLALAFLSPMIAWVPISSLAGILLVIAWRMIDKNSVKLLKYSSGRLDFAVIAGVVLVAITVDLIAAAGVGIALSILLFIRDQVRGSVILSKNYLNQLSSKTLRSDTQREILTKHGGVGVICKLQGNLFFGTTDQLFTNLQEDLKTKKYILLDMRKVQSIDYTGVHLLEQMQAQLKERGGQLMFSGMPSGLYSNRDFEIYLKNMGLVKSANGVKVFETLDSALESIEEGILLEFGKQEDRNESKLGLGDFRLFRDFDSEQMKSLQACVTEKSYTTGERIFSHGVSGDEMFLVRKGSVRVLLPLDRGRFHHLATISKGSIFGELAFLDGGIRSADVEAKEPTDLFIVSRKRFNEQSHKNPSLGVQVFARMALAVSERLREADAELRVLEER